MGPPGLPRRFTDRRARRHPRNPRTGSRRWPPVGGAGPTATRRHRGRPPALLWLFGLALLVFGTAAQLAAGTAPARSGPADPAARAGNAPPQVLVTTVDGAITPVTADHLGDVISRAEADDFDAAVIQLDTPGGLAISMRDIVQDVLAAEVPVVVYVTPEGARAASAGAIITFSAHVAAMAPATAIGAATPVNLAGDEDLSDSDRKAINDAAETATSVAERRDRNPDFAEDTVREGRSAAASEAVEIDAVDLISPDLSDLLDEIDGRTVTVAPDDTSVTLRTADAEVTTMDMGLFRQVQQFLADPNLAFLFLSVGTLGFIYELANPGVSGAGIAGAILLILAMFSVAVLPVSAVGLLLLGIAGALFVAELFAPGIGVAAAGGTAALVLGGVFLFRGTPGLAVSLWVMAPVALTVGGGVVFAGRLVWRSRKRPSTSTGTGLFLDRTVTVTDVSDRGDHGRTFVEGAWWQVRNRDGALSEGGNARVVEVSGLTLIAAPTGAATDEQSDPSADNTEGPTPRETR